MTKKTVKFNLCRVVFRMETGKASIQVEFKSSVLGVQCHLGRLAFFCQTHVFNGLGEACLH